MKTTKQTILLILGAVVLMLTAVQCTKEGTNASLISRALVETPDSTVYSSFYDTFKIAKADAVADVNDVIRTNGVLSIIKSNCASAACHGGAIAPKLTTYNEIKALVVPGNPEASELFDLVTTSEKQKAMPPVTYGVDLSVSEKTKIYNWIKNGAKEVPGLEDFRPAAISLVVNGCGSGNCHNQATVGGEWARKGWFAFTSTDTTSFVYNNPGSGTTSYYAQLKQPLLNTVWKAYKDSVKKFYADTLANASFRPFKTFGTPWTTASRRGPLNDYDDIIMDIMYPKGIRSNSSVVYTNPTTLAKYYVRGDYLNSSNNFIGRIDSTILPANPRTGIFATSNNGAMAWDDGGLTPSEVAIIKAWYFADPNVPDVWKYGLSTGTGIFKYKKSGTIITK